MTSIENLVLQAIEYLSEIDEFMELVRSEGKDVLTYFETTLYTAFTFEKGDLVTYIYYWKMDIILGLFLNVELKER